MAFQNGVSIGLVFGGKRGKQFVGVESFGFAFELVGDDEVEPVGLPGDVGFDPVELFA